MARENRNLAILFFTLVVVLIGFGIVIPIFPFYIESFGARGQALGLLMATYAVMQFLFAPIWGQLSDRQGRKPILLLGVLGNALAMLFMGLSTQLWMLFVARALAGVLSSATLPTAMAYVGDSTREEDRGGGMGLLGAAMGVGMVIGPGLGGVLAERSLPIPFYAAAALSLLAFLLILILLPESLPKDSRTQAPNQTWGPDLGGMLKALSGPLKLVFLLAFLLSFGLTNFESVFGLYALERYGYGPQRVGLLLTLIGLTSAIVQGVLTGPFTRRWGEAIIIRASLLGSAIGFVIMLAADRFLTVFITVTFFILSNAMLRPAISSLVSKRARRGQGVAMGLNNAFMSVGRIIGPAWAGFAFDVNMNSPYLSGAAAMFIGFAITAVWSSNPATVQYEAD